jgi:hypothetical protein
MKWLRRLFRSRPQREIVIMVYRNYGSPNYRVCGTNELLVKEMLERIGLSALPRNKRTPIQ